MNLPELYMDNHLFVVNKPAGLLSQADHTGDPDVLTIAKAIVKERFDKPGNVFIGLVHRLDRPASGVMVLARTSKAAARLSEQFRLRTVTKEYLALVEGYPGDGGEWTDHLVKRDQAVSVVRPEEEGALEARLTWTAVGRVGDQAVIHVRLVTGRPHQIRVQFAHRGYPVVGDFRYGGRIELDGRNLALHCARMGVDHPTRGESMTWSTLPPPSWPVEAREVAGSYMRSSI